MTAESREPVEAPARVIPDLKPAVKGVQEAGRKVGIAAEKVGTAAERMEKTAYQKVMLDGVVIGVVAMIALYLLARVLGGK